VLLDNCISSEWVNHLYLFELGYLEAHYSGNALHQAILDESITSDSLASKPMGLHLLLEYGTDGDTHWREILRASTQSWKQRRITLSPLTIGTMSLNITRGWRPQHGS